jgi:hypothetical protein
MPFRITNPVFALPVVLVARGVEDGGTRSTRSLAVDVDVSDMHNNGRRQWRWSEFDRLPRSGSTAYGLVVGIYPIPDYPVLPEPEP